MNDAEFLAALEDCTLPADAFRHRDHLRAAWLYPQRMPFGAALDRMRATLQRYAASLGRPDRYHETITVAYMSLVQAHRALHPADCWDDFVARNPELFAAGLLTSYYDRATLDSPLARQVFVLEPRSLP
jgi:hypothetical protein